MNKTINITRIKDWYKISVWMAWKYIYYETWGFSLWKVGKFEQRLSFNDTQIKIGIIDTLVIKRKL